MSTLPRPTGKELGNALERAASLPNSFEVAALSGRQGTVVPLKTLSDCGIKPEQLDDLL